MNLPATKPACTLTALLLPWGIALLLALLWLSGVDLGAWVDKLSPGCLFHRLTGWYCPGCGGTRATVALLHGDCPAAVRYNFFGCPASSSC